VSSGSKHVTEISQLEKMTFARNMLLKDCGYRSIDLSDGERDFYADNVKVMFTISKEDAWSIMNHAITEIAAGH